MLQIKSVDKPYGINFPTSLNEFTPEVLTSIAESVKLPPYYAIVGLCFEIKLFDFAMNIRSGKSGSSQVVPILVKAHQEDMDKRNISIGDKVIVDRSSLERGVHLKLPLAISADNATAYLKDDEKLMTNIIKGTNKDAKVTDPIIQNMIDNKHNSIFIIEFKLIAATDIVASLHIDSKVVDPFKFNPKELVS